MQVYRRLTWLVVALWLLYGLTQLDYNGPFFDEAIYITAGQRTLEPERVTGRYHTNRSERSLDRNS